MRPAVGSFRRRAGTRALACALLLLGVGPRAPSWGGPPPEAPRLPAIAGIEQPDGTWVFPLQDAASLLAQPSVSRAWRRVDLGWGQDAGRRVRVYGLVRRDAPAGTEPEAWEHVDPRSGLVVGGGERGLPPREPVERGAGCEEAR